MRISYNDLLNEIMIIGLNIDNLSIELIDQFVIKVNIESLKIFQEKLYYCIDSIDNEYEIINKLDYTFTIDVPFIDIMPKILMSKYNIKIIKLDNSTCAVTFQYNANLNAEKINYYLLFISETIKLIYSELNDLINKKYNNIRELIHAIYNNDIYCESHMDIYEFISLLFNNKVAINKQDIEFYYIENAVSNVIFAKILGMKVTSASDVTFSKKHISDLFKIIENQDNHEFILSIFDKYTSLYNTNIEDTMIHDKIIKKEHDLNLVFPLNTMQRIIFVYKVKNIKDFITIFRKFYKTIISNDYVDFDEENYKKLNNMIDNEKYDLKELKEVFHQVIKGQRKLKIKSNIVIKLIEDLIYKIVYN